MCATSAGVKSVALGLSTTGSALASACECHSILAFSATYKSKNANLTTLIGRAVRIAEEESFIFDSVRLAHCRIRKEEFRGFLIGENLRDWASSVDTWVWYPYFAGRATSSALEELWQWRSTLAGRKTFQGVMADSGLQWFEYMQHTPSAYATRFSIPFAFVATHNHFVLDQGGKVFKVISGLFHTV